MYNMPGPYVNGLLKWKLQIVTFEPNFQNVDFNFTLISDDFIVFQSRVKFIDLIYNWPFLLYWIASDLLFPTMYNMPGPYVNGLVKWKLKNRTFFSEMFKISTMCRFFNLVKILKISKKWYDFQLSFRKSMFIPTRHVIHRWKEEVRGYSVK